MKIDLKQYGYSNPLIKNNIISKEDDTKFRTKNYLREELGFPSNQIQIDAKVYGGNNRPTETADIILSCEDHNGQYYAAIINFARAPFPITETLIATTKRQCNTANGLYAIVSDGDEFRIFKYTPEINDYTECDSMPNYNVILQEITTWLFDFDNLDKHFFEKRAFLSDNGIIGINTPHNIAMASYLLYISLGITKRKMPTGKYGYFEVLEDKGLCPEQYGNASGGYFTGDYREIVVKHKGEYKTVTFNVSTYANDEATISKTETALSIGVNTRNNSHHSLQLALDRQCGVFDNNLILHHNGSMTVGNLGSVKRQDVLKGVQKRMPSLIDADRIELGKLPANRFYGLDEPEIVKTFEKLISYALIRDEIRDEIRALKV